MNFNEFKAFLIAYNKTTFKKAIKYDEKNYENVFVDNNNQMRVIFGVNFNYPDKPTVIIHDFLPFLI